MTSTSKPSPSASIGHRWRFFRAGGFDQVQIDTGADLMALGGLDQKLWVALSCPVDGIEFDRKTLEFVDADGDGHIRAPEILGALRWAGTVLKDPDLLVGGKDGLPLDAIDGGTDEGRAVLAGAKFVLGVLGRADAGEIALDDVADAQRIYSLARFNGDGVVHAAAAREPALGSVVEEIVACFGPEIDRSGAPGATAASIERFYAEARSLADWRESATSRPGVLPFGEDTKARHGLFAALEPKIDDYFRRCRLASYDARAAALLSPSEADYGRLAVADLGEDARSVAPFPLAVAGPGKPLPLSEGLNPAWSAKIREFARDVAAPLLGDGDALSEAGWDAIRARFAPYEAWLAARPATALEKLEPARVTAIIAEDGREALLDLVARDKAVEAEVAAIPSVEKILRYRRHLHRLVDNFVSFRNFYTRRGKAMFQAGTLYLDGRSCDLCVPVADVSRHAAVATLSRVCLVYCDCTRRGGGEKMTVAAGFTAGDSDHLRTGRNGVFYDRAGRDWDATIVRIVEHPISIRQAFWGPYKRVARMVGEQVQKIAAARSKSVEEQAAAQVVAAGEKVAGRPAPPPPPPFDVAKFAGIFAAIGLAVGAIGTALASVLAGIFRLAWWQIPLAVGGIVLVISGPATILAWFNLRKRNLGPILDANGWAVNARAKINIPFGASLTAAAKLPENADRSLADPFAEKRRPWGLYLLLLIAVAGGVMFLWMRGILSLWTGSH